MCLIMWPIGALNLEESKGNPYRLASFTLKEIREVQERDMENGRTQHFEFLGLV